MKTPQEWLMDNPWPDHYADQYRVIEAVQADARADPLAERDRLSLRLTNAKNGDCLYGELGTIECRLEAPCWVCQQRAEREKLVALLREAMVYIYTAALRPVDAYASACHKDLIRRYESAVLQHTPPSQEPT